MTVLDSPGSSIYYSLIHTDAQVRENILNYRRIYRKLKNIKPVAAEWWQHELQKTPELLPLLKTFLDNSQTNLYEDNLSLHNFYKNTAGLLEKSLGKFYGITDDKTLDTLENLGIFIEKVNHIRDFKKHLELGKIYFSGEALLKHRVNLYELSQLTLTPAIRLLFEDEASQTFGYYTKLKNKHIRPTLILSNIQKALLEEIKKSGFPVFRHHISLTPLRKWWIANRS
jgi:phytoene/squalene synthetase